MIKKCLCLMFAFLLISFLYTTSGEVFESWKDSIKSHKTDSEKPILEIKVVIIGVDIYVSATTNQILIFHALVLLLIFLLFSCALSKTNALVCDQKKEPSSDAWELKEENKELAERLEYSELVKNTNHFLSTHNLTGIRITEEEFFNSECLDHDTFFEVIENYVTTSGAKVQINFSDDFCITVITPGEKTSVRMEKDDSLDDMKNMIILSEMVVDLIREVLISRARQNS